MFEDITVFLIWLLATWIVSNIIIGFLGIYQQTDSKIRDQLIKHLDTIIHRVRVEKHNEVYFWYDNDDGEFLAQGQTDEEIINNLKQRFPTHIFYLPTSHFISQKTNWQPRHQHVETVDQ